MKFEKLTENKIRIILNIEDLKEKNIDFHSFMSNSLESQDLFLDMLEQAEEEIGFATKDYKLIIEALASLEGNFVLTITRVTPENDAKQSQKKVQTKRKSALPNQVLSMYAFNSFDEFCEFCTYIKNSLLQAKLKRSILYQYNNKYYLTLHNMNLSADDFKSFHCASIEFSAYVHHPDIFERKLVEHGKIIIPKNAIGTCIKHFA